MSKTRQALQTAKYNHNKYKFMYQERHRKKNSNDSGNGSEKEMETISTMHTCCNVNISSFNPSVLTENH